MQLNDHVMISDYRTVRELKLLIVVRGVSVLRVSRLTRMLLKDLDFSTSPTRLKETESRMSTN